MLSTSPEHWSIKISHLMTYAKYPECNIFVDTKMWNLLIQIHIDGNYIHSIICPFVLMEIVYSAPSKDPLGGAPITVIMMSWANFAHTLLFGSNRIPKRSEFQSEGATPEWEWTALHALHGVRALRRPRRRWRQQFDHQIDNNVFVGRLQCHAGVYVIVFLNF